MGPVMNLALAVVVMALVLLPGRAGFRRSKQSRWSSAAFASDSAGAGRRREGRRPHRRRSTTSRSRPGSSSISSWCAQANRQVRLTIERDGKRIERQVVPAAVDKYETGAIGVMPVTHPQIAEVHAGQPGDEGGLRAGDVVMAAGGEANVSRERLIELIQAHDGKSLEARRAARWRAADIHGHAAVH